MSPENKRKFRETYRKCKKYGIRTLFGLILITAGSICQVAYEIDRGELKSYRKKIGLVLATTSAYLFSSGLVLASNATRIVKIAKMTDKICSAAYRTANNYS